MVPVGRAQQEGRSDVHRAFASEILKVEELQGGKTQSVYVHWSG